MTGGADETPGSEDVDGPTATPKVVALRHAPAPEGAAPHHAPGAQRRHLTLAFVDLIDSTALATRLDPEDLQQSWAAFTPWSPRPSASSTAVSSMARATGS